MRPPLSSRMNSLPTASLRPDVGFDFVAKASVIALSFHSSGLRACLSKQFQWVDGKDWVGGAHRLCADKHWASTKQALFGSGPPPRAGWILWWRHNALK